MELNHSLWRVPADSKASTDRLREEEIFNLYISYTYNDSQGGGGGGAGGRCACQRLSASVQRSRSTPDLRSLAACLSFSERQVAWSDNHPFLGEAGGGRCGGLGGLDFLERL